MKYAINLLSEELKSQVGIRAHIKYWNKRGKETRDNLPDVELRIEELKRALVFLGKNKNV